eukprot:TRINITY_DN4862_c0_g1_i1.p1 TRINITY_DN4862_c0_g1~~TRINITY_DN4862_c0_g1_i1.p1  ORF type:complete len:408 (-),score=78.91 TRINITY_DN4862_c0_g1_i1:125-1348(-)
MESLVESFYGLFSSKRSTVALSEGENSNQEPAQSYLESIDIPELWVRIFLEVDYGYYSAARKEKRKPVAREVLRLSEVCKAWRDVVYSNDVWKVLSQRRWKKVKLNARIQNWMKFYSRRYLSERKMAPLKAHAVSNCPSLEFEYECPIIVELMDANQRIPKERICLKCSETVYLCKNESEIEYHIAQNHCVSFDKYALSADNYHRFHPIPLKLHVFSVSPRLGASTFTRKLVHSLITTVDNLHRPIQPKKINTISLYNPNATVAIDRMKGPCYIYPSEFKRTIAAFCFSVTNRTSFNEAKEKIKDYNKDVSLSKGRTERPVGILVGLNCEHRERTLLTTLGMTAHVSSREAEAFAKEMDWEYIEAANEDVLPSTVISKVLNTIRVVTQIANRLDAAPRFTGGIMIAR